MTPAVYLAQVYLSHYRRHPGQLAGLLLILACAAMLWSGVQSLTSRGAASIEASVQAQAPQLSLQRLDRRPLGVDDFALLRRAGLCVTPRLNLQLELNQGGSPGAGNPQSAPSSAPRTTLRLLGVDPLTAGCLPSLPWMSAVLDAAAPELLAGQETGQGMASLGALWGSSAALLLWKSSEHAVATEYALHQIPDLPADLLVGDIATIATLARQIGREARLELLMPAPLTRMLPPGYEAVLQDYGVSSAPLANSFLLSLEALGWLALLVAALLVRAVYLFSMEQRRRSLDILYRQGVELWRLRLYLLLEMLLLCVLGGALGVWLGHGLAGLLADGFRGTLAGLFSVEGLGAGLSAAELWLRAAFILLVLLAWACSDILLLRSSVRSGEARRAEGLWGGLAGVLLMQAGVLGLALDTPLWLIFAATGACLLGAGLLLPRLLSLLLGGLQTLLQRRPGRVLLEWSCSEMQALCRLLRLPLLALAFAIASAIGIQAMVTGFESTFARWLDQRLQGQLYLDPGQPVALQDWVAQLQALPQVVAVLPQVRGRALVEQQAVDVLGVDPESALVSGWDFLESAPQPWQALQGQGLMVNEQLARRQRLKLGDWIKVRMGSLEKLYQVAAIYADYGRPDGEILLASRHLPAALPGRYTTFVLGLAPGPAPDWQRWSQQYPWLGGSRLRDQASLKAGARAVFGRTFDITGALSGLTLLLSGVALMLMALTLFRLRQRLYSWIYVCGLTRGQLRWRLCAHAMLLTTVLGVLATPLGIFLSWVLVARVNPVAFGWALPFNLYPAYWLQVWLACLLVGAVTGLLMVSPVRLETLKNE